MNERAVHITIGCFACLMLIAIVLSVRLSTVQPPYGTQVYGSYHVWRGHTAAFRVLLLDPDGYTVLAPNKLTVSLRDERGVRMRQEASPGELTTVSLAVPADLEAYASLDIDVERPEGTDHVTVALRADAQPAPEGRVAPWGENQTARATPPAASNPWRVALYPANGRFVGGLDNDVGLRLTRNTSGAPRRPAAGDSQPAATDQAAADKATGENQAAADRPTGENQAAADKATGENQAAADRPTGENQAAADRPTGENQAAAGRPGDRGVLGTRAVGTSRPMAAKVTCQALNLAGTTDSAGLLRFIYRPGPKGGDLRFVVDDDTQNPVDVHLEAKPTQLTIAVEGNTLVTPGTTPAVNITTLPFRDTLHADLWVGSALVASTQAMPERGQLRLALPVPADAQGLVRWSVYRNLARPEDTAAHVVRWAPVTRPGAAPGSVNADINTTLDSEPSNIAPGNAHVERNARADSEHHALSTQTTAAPTKSDHDALSTQTRAAPTKSDHDALSTQTRAALELLTKLPGTDPVVDALAQPPAGAEIALLALALSRFVPESAGPLLLASTSEARRAVFEAAKEGERGHIHVFFAGVTALGLLLACVLLVRHHRRTRSAVGEVLRESEAAGEGLEAAAARRVSTTEHIYLLLLALAALAMAGYGLFELLSKMRWDR